jgi:hypothetical protein
VSDLSGELATHCWQGEGTPMQFAMLTLVGALKVHAIWLFLLMRSFSLVHLLFSIEQKHNKDRTKRNQKEQTWGVRAKKNRLKHNEVRVVLFILVPFRSVFILFLFYGEYEGCARQIKAPHQKKHSHVPLLSNHPL